MGEVLRLAEGLAKPFESLRLKAYHDCVGYPTQGYGHLLSREVGADLSRWPDIDESTAEAWLEQDLLRTYRSVLGMVRVPLTAWQFAAIVDLAFNVGAGAVRASTLLRMVNRGEVQEAADQFLLWNKAGGRVWKGLTRRRIADRRVFLGDF